ncbi:MAG: tetratricopeptide repeat protein [Acidobacteria bacterium]|nr:tetratricopeptide repeat protein [Acidobacteriota bacterium]
MSRKKTRPTEPPPVTPQPSVAEVRPSDPIVRPRTGIAGWAQRHPILLVCLGLITLNLVVFGRVVSFEFIDFDDNSYVFNNPNVRQGLTLANLKWAFTTFHVGHWHPLTWISYFLDFELFGLKPGGFHAVNLLFHQASTVLIFLALNRMTRAFWHSAVVALLFAIHPTHVEPVVWIASRKDVLSTFFGVLAVWAYAGYAQLPFSWKRYLLVCLWLALGLLAKSMLITLPFALLLLDYWPLNRFSTADTHSIKLFVMRAIRLGIEKIPFFILISISLVMQLRATRGMAPAVMATMPDTEPLGPLAPGSFNPVSVRLSAYAVYLFKLFFPVQLGMYYPLEQKYSYLWLGFVVLLLVVITVYGLRNMRSMPYLVVGWFWYLGTLFPVSHLLLADRYTYVSTLGLLVMMVWWLADWLNKTGRESWAPPISAVVGLACLVLTWNQVGHWRTTRTIFEHTLAVTQDNLVIHHNLGRLLMDCGDYSLAEKHFREVVRLSPNSDFGLNSLGKSLLKQHKPGEAQLLLTQTLQKTPRYGAAHQNMGLVQLEFFEQTKDPAHLTQAIEHLMQTTKLLPKYADGYANLGLACFKLGNFDQAIAAFHEARRLKPRFYEAIFNLANVYYTQQKFDQAFPLYLEAIELRPDQYEPYRNLGAGYLLQGKPAEALVYFQKGVEIKPDWVEGYFHLGDIYTLLAGQHHSAQYLASAITQYQTALELRPDFAAARLSLANLLLGIEKIAEAEAEVQTVLRQNPDSPGAHLLLSKILRKQGKLSEAEAHERRTKE